MIFRDLSEIGVWDERRQRRRQRCRQRRVLPYSSVVASP
jgi:hypothetical protein